MESYLCQLGSWPDIDPSACPISADVLPWVKRVLLIPQTPQERAEQRKVYLDILADKKGVVVSYQRPGFINLTTSYLSAEQIHATCKRCPQRDLHDDTRDGF